MYALYQNKDNTEGVKAALGAVVPHIHDDHTRCGRWCKAGSTTTYRYRGLPKGRPLVNVTTRRGLENIMACYIANASKLSPLANSQNNESANNIIASKAPKSRYYGGSESSDFRVAAAICQKNIGRAYIPTVLERLSLSPGQTCVSFTQREDKVRDRQAAYKCETAVKKHRCVLKNLRATEQNGQEVREGVTYEHDCGLEEDGPDELEIPSVTCKPKLDVCENIDYEEVCFDLETSKGGYSAEITQLSAVASGGSVFNTYILPNYHIQTRISELTGITIEMCDGERVMCHNGQRVTHTSAADGLRAFTDWLATLGRPILLVAHNCVNFDMVHLLRYIDTCNLNANLSASVVGLSDSLPMFKTLYPERPKGTFSQPVLYADIVHGEYDAHNAIADVKALQQLLSKSVATAASVVAHSCTLGSAVQHVQYMVHRDALVKSLKIKLCTGSKENRVLSPGMALKAASSGLGYSHMKLAYVRGKSTGLSALLQERFEGKPRVTKDSRIIASICHHFQIYSTT
jgi:DNA polymerase III epsilon subunit-like protein